MKIYENVIKLLRNLKLKGMEENLDEELNEAQSGKSSYLNFLKSLLEVEMDARNERRINRNMTAAHFPILKDFENFNFGNVKGITQSAVNELLDFNWLDNKNNILFFGPPGVGKTHLSLALGIKAAKSGYSVCFERISNLMKLIAMSNIQKTAAYRLNRISKANLIIIDEIGYTPIEKKEANLFFSLISELYEKSSIIITSNKGFDSWAEMLGDEIMTTALLDRLLHHAKIFNLDGESYRLKTIKKGGK